MSPRVRPAEPRDLDALVAIAAEASVDGAAAAQGRAHFEDELRREASSLLVACGADGNGRGDASGHGDGADVLGYVLTWSVVDELHVLDVAVARAARRLGVGRALLDAALARARAAGAARVLLEVRAGNVAARALYAALGFTAFHVRPRYYDDGEDAVELERRLDGAAGLPAPVPPRPPSRP